MQKHREGTESEFVREKIKETARKGGVRGTAYQDWESDGLATVCKIAERPTVPWWL